MSDIEGKVAVVLGASAAGGTGWAVAEHLAAAGAKVVVSARRREPLEELASKIGGIAVVCDAGKGDEIAALAGRIKEEFGGLDIAVNSAALPIIGTIAETDPGEVQKSVDVNFIGHVNFVREMGAIMRDDGSIILISTASAQQPVMPFFPYACAKAATDCLVKYAALEYGPRGIRVNSILPGPIRSDMATQLFANPGAEAVFCKEIPLGRVGETDDFARIVTTLAGKHYMTGVNIPVSGGMQLTRSARGDEMPSGHF